MKKMKWKQILSGVMAVMTVLTSTVPSMNVYAAEPENGENVLPFYEEVKEYLSPDEVVTAGDYEIEYGTAFDVDSDFSGIEIADESKVTVKLHEAKNEDGENFNSSHADTYHAVYYVEPVSGNPSYQIGRNIIVKEPAETASTETGTVSGGDAGQSEETEDDGEAEPDPEPDSDFPVEETMPAEIAEQVIADSEANTINEETITAGGEEAVVVFADNRMSRSSGSANLVVGKKVGYPSNLGNYSTHYFYVNGKLAYCLESMKGFPPSGDYAYDVLVNNSNLQKALYYGYGGAGDLTDVFMSQFDADLKYVFTHLAASYFYCGMDAFHGCTMEDIIACGVWGYIEFLASQPEPMDPYISFSKSNLTASYDGTQQVTDKITLNGDSRNYITLNLPADVTYHNTNTGATSTGGTVYVYGGTTFYFTAPTSVTTDWSTGDMYGSVSTSWKAIVVKTAEGKQDIGSYYEETQQNAVSFSVDWLELARVGVYKVDSKVEDAKLAGAVFGIYKDKVCTQLITKMPKTNTNGYTEVEILKTQDTVYLKEITAPIGYRRNTTAYNVNLVANETTTVTVPDVEQLAELTIYKEGQVLVGADVTDKGVVFHYENKRLSNATYNVYAGKDIYTGYGALVYSKGELVRENLTTNGDGLVVLKNLHLGTYLVKEVKAPEDYVLNDSEQTVVLSYGGQEVEVVFGSATFVNDRQKASVSVVKKDKDTLNPLDGGVFGLYANSNITDVKGKVIVPKGTLIETVTTGENGKAAFTSDLPIGFSYSVKEIKAPHGYYRNTKDVYTFDFSYTNSKEAVVKFSHTFVNERVNATIQLVKKDKETGGAQGDATLDGAVYGLYARNDIVHPDGTTGVIYRAGQQITTLTTDKAGKASVKNLYLGNYYVKEITASEGYLLDETEYDLHCDYESDLTLTVERSCTSLEQVKKQPFQLIKVSDNGDDTEAPLLEGAGFTAYLKSSLSVKEDGSYDFKAATPVVIGKNGATEIFSDKTGHVVSIAIPYGTYVVVESTTPHNMETIKPFEVKITENKPNTPQIWRVFIDREFSAKLRIVKKDADTGKTVLVPNAEFKIFNMDTGKYVTMFTTYPSKEEHTSFFTDADGDLILPETLKIGNYRIEEVAAPDGYVLNTNYVEIAVDTDTFYEVDPDTYEAIITVEYEDASAVGELTVEKKGEILDGYKGGIFADSEEKEFVYKEGSLAGAKFEVYAAEDIFTADMQKDENGNRTKYYSKGDLVATLVTGENGKATLSDLPMGQYKVVEVEAPYGYVLNEEEQVVTFVYVDDKTPVIYESVVFSNDRQKLSMSVMKLDAEEKTPIAGAEFGLYAAEDIKNADGKVIVEAGTLLETVISDENGKIAFTKDYPFGVYEARELAAPAGYVSSDEIITFDAEYQGQDVAVAEYSSEFLNTPTTFEFTKEDITSGAELSGATLTVLDKDGNVIDSWTSVAGEAHVIKRLVVGETYTLREEFAPYGYLKAEDIQFTVEDTGDIQSVVMKDKVPTGTILINKDGELLTDISVVKDHWYDFIFNYFRGSLAGVEFEVYAAEDIVSPDGLDTVYYEADELVATIVTNEKGIAKIEELPLGKYYVVETKTLEGFVLDSTPIEADLSYIDQDTEIVYAGMSVTNERQKVKITVIKKDAETKEALEGAVFGLFAKEDIVNKDGTVVVKADTQIERGVTDTDGKLTFESDLPLGQYYVKELEAPKGYAISDAVFDVDASYQGDDVKVIELEAEFENAPTVFEFTKEDITSGAELSGATLTVLDKDGNVIDTWTSVAGEAHVIKRLVVGETYTLREEFAPYGYLRAEDILFTVEDTGEIQSVVMKDEVPTGTILINKDGEFLTDISMVKTHWYDFIFNYFRGSLAGVEFEVYAAEDIVSPDGLDTVYYEADELVATIVTDEKGIAKIEELPLGKYYLVETKTLAGFVLDSTPIEADLSYIDQDTEIVYAGMSITNERQKVQITVTKKDAETKEALEGAVFGLFAKEDIVNPDGTVVVKADTQIECAVTGKDGKLIFVSDLPLGQYYVKELEAPKGYVKSDEVFDVDASYQGDDVKVIELEAEFENTPIKVEFTKTDITGENELEGAVLSVIDSEGNLVEKWTSGKEAHLIERLPVGKYILREETAPFGYVIAQDVEFEVTETAKIQKVTMKDEAAVGKIIINKKSEDGKLLPGAEFEIRDKNGNVIETIITDSEGHAVSKELPIATFKDGKYETAITYTVVEVKAPEGYLLDSTPKEVTFEYQDGETPVIEYNLDVTNKPTEPKLPQTGDNFNPWLFGGLGAAAVAVGLVAFFWKKKEDKDETEE